LFALATRRKFEHSIPDAWPNDRFRTEWDHSANRTEGNQVPEAPTISVAVAATAEQHDDGSTSEGSSIEPGEKPGDTDFGSHVYSGGAMLLSQLRRSRLRRS
jgi:hypothetical protein